jgi:hypothetical protein
MRLKSFARLTRRMRRDQNLAALLTVVALLQFGYPVSLYGLFWNACYLLLYAGMLVFGIRMLRAEGHRTLPVYVLAVPFAGFGLWSGIDRDDTTARLGLLLLVAAFQLLLMGSLLVFIFRRGRRGGGPEPKLILAALCFYLLLGGFFAALFGALEAHHPGSFADPASDTTGALPWQTLLYYSYITMVAVGYGDIVPVAPWARSLATMAAVTGTLFLATVIARLAGAYLTPATTDHDHRP